MHTICKSHSSKCQLLTENLWNQLFVCSQLHLCYQEQIPMQPWLSWPCLLCMVTSKLLLFMFGDVTIAAIYLFLFHSLGSGRGLLSDRKPSDSKWSIQESHTHFTMHHPMCCPMRTNTRSSYISYTSQQNRSIFHL